MNLLNKFFASISLIFIIGCGTDPEELPLFPTTTGAEVAKAAMVTTITFPAAAAGAPTRDERGGRLFGGHSLRTGGAALLASSPWLLSNRYESV